MQYVGRAHIPTGGTGTNGCPPLLAAQLEQIPMDDMIAFDMLKAICQDVFCKVLPPLSPRLDWLSPILSQKVS